jgi:hypothetical protein
MKIALCFSGQARSFEKGYEYYKRNLLDRYDVDVYIHSWKRDATVGEKSIVDLYNPVGYLFEDPPETDANTKYTHTPDIQKYPPRNNYLQFYSMYKCSTLIQGNYDWVIRSRTDYALNVAIPFEELDSNYLYIPNCRMVPERDFGNDQFAFSSQENMMKYMSTFTNLDKYYDAGAQFVGEDLMRANLHEHGLFGDKLIYANMNNPFPPGLHNGTWHSLIRDDIDQWTKS